MFIICPKCGAKYQIPQGTTLENGQKLKCSACGHLFTKGEEAPVVLDKLATPPQESATEAFSKPLYHIEDTPQKQKPTLPEVFQPLPESIPTHKGLWIIPIYIILLIVLCIAGWKFRYLLSPSFSEIIPAPSQTRTITLPGPRQPALEFEKPIPTQVPQTQPTEVPTPVPLAEPTLIPTQEPTIQPTPEPTLMPTHEPTPEPALETAEIMPSDEPDDAPLFEIVAKEIPAPTNDITAPNGNISTPTSDILTPTRIQNVSYQIEMNEQNVPQLLVNGILQNMTTEIQSVPTLTLFVYNNQNNLLAQKEIHLTTEILAPNESVPFYTGLIPAPDGIDHITVQ